MRKEDSAGGHNWDWQLAGMLEVEVKLGWRQGRSEGNVWGTRFCSVNLALGPTPTGSSLFQWTLLFFFFMGLDTTIVQNTPQRDHPEG